MQQECLQRSSDEPYPPTRPLLIENAYKLQELEGSNLNVWNEQAMVVIFGVLLTQWQVYFNSRHSRHIIRYSIDGEND